MIGPKGALKPAKRPQGLSKPVRETVLERDRYRCFRCGRSAGRGDALVTRSLLRRIGLLARMYPIGRLTSAVPRSILNT